MTSETESALRGEGIIQTGYEKIFVLRGNGFDLVTLNQKIEELIKLAHEQDAPAIKTKLREIVPDYQPSNGHFSPPPQKQ